MAKLIAALVLCDLAAHQVKAGSILEAAPETIKALASSGEVDPHKDALSHARSEGATTVRSAIELAAEQIEAAKQALLVAIAELDQLLAAAQDDETKAAIEAKIAAKRVELSALA